MRILFIVVSICFLTACGVTLTAPTQTDVDRGVKKFPGLTLTELTEGQNLFKTKCSQCHGLKNPTSRNEEQWRKVVPKMAGKAERKANKEKIDAAAQEKILKYLITTTLAK